MIRKSLIMLACCALLLSVGSAQAARPDKDWKTWFGNLALGYAGIDGDGGGESFDDDWYWEGGATFWPETAPIGLNLNVSYSDYDVSNSAINSINDALEDDGQERLVSGGDMSIWGITADAVWGTRTSGKFDFSVAAGVGMYYYDARVTTNGIIYYPGGCGWYWCWPGWVEQGQVSLAGQSDWEWGWNVGVSFDFEVGSSGSQIFLEVKYHAIELDRNVELTPIVLGYRW